MDERDQQETIRKLEEKYRNQLAVRNQAATGHFEAMKKTESWAEDRKRTRQGENEVGGRRVLRRHSLKSLHTWIQVATVVVLTGLLLGGVGVLQLAAVSTAPSILAAGDISCGPAEVQTTRGSGTNAGCDMKATSDIVLAVKPKAVLALGDDQYKTAALNDFLTEYDPTWGRIKSITYPVPGNHEYQASKHADGYFAYYGPRAGDPHKGYYSFDIGTWHVIALNAQCAYIHGCYAGSPQETWLRSDLASHGNTCTLAFWHQPRFSSGAHGSDIIYQPMFNDLYQYHADVLLVGHDHDYERFAPQNPKAKYDPAHGITEFVVGTGGSDHSTFHHLQPNSLVRNDHAFGLLRMTLYPSSYKWTFIPVPGARFTDAGSAQCH